jgi:hypothetical protein
MTITVESPSGFVIHNPDINNLKSDMIDNFPEYWHQGNGAAAINYRIDDIFQYTLVVLPSDNYGLYLKYLIKENGRVIEEWLSMQNPLLLDSIVECSDEWYASIGLFLPLEKAWLAIKEFLDSGEKSMEITWVTSAAIPENGNW